MQFRPAYTQVVKMKDAPRFLKLPATECSMIWIRVRRAGCPAHWDNINDTQVHSESRFIVGTKLGGKIAVTN